MSITHPQRSAEPFHPLRDQVAQLAKSHAPAQSHVQQTAAAIDDATISWRRGGDGNCNAKGDGEVDDNGDDCDGEFTWTEGGRVIYYSKTTVPTVDGGTLYHSLDQIESA